MKNILRPVHLILVMMAFGSCQRPVMRATFEGEQTNLNVMTYTLINKTQNADELYIHKAIESHMNKSGFFKTPFRADLKIVYRYNLAENTPRNDKKIQVVVLDATTDACIWKGETVRLPKNVSSEKMFAYTHLLMQRFEWQLEDKKLLVKN